MDVSPCAKQHAYAYADTGTGASIGQYTTARLSHVSIRFCVGHDRSSYQIEGAVQQDIRMRPVDLGYL
jgi:hypothetical protein